MSVVKVEAAPRLCRPFLFSKPPPPQKIRMERSGKARGRDARYSARGGVLGDRSALFWVKATTRSARANLGVLLEIGSDFLIQ